MKNTVAKKGKNKDENILQNIFKEIRLLRSEVTLFMPTEDLKEYAHPFRIKSSFDKAIKQYPRSI